MYQCYNIQMGLAGVFRRNPMIGSFYRNEKERSIFIVIESISIVLVANKKTRSKNSLI